MLRGVGGRLAMGMAMRGVRRLSSAPCPWAVLGLPQGAEPQQIKRRFYQLAKQTHPDVADVEEEAEHSFVQILAAFELLTLEGGHSTATSDRSTASNASARGGGGPGGARRRAPDGGPSGAARERGLGDILCERLAEEPDKAREVWGDIVEQSLNVHVTMLEAIFRACGSRGGGGLPVALEILRDATQRGLLFGGTKEAAVISIIKWCKEDSTSFSRIVSELGEEERTPAVRESLAYANALYSGFSDGYSAS